MISELFLNELAGWLIDGFVGMNANWIDLSAINQFKFKPPNKSNINQSNKARNSTINYAFAFKHSASLHSASLPLLFSEIG